MKQFEFHICDEQSKKLIKKIKLQLNTEYVIGREGSQADIIIGGSNTVSRSHAKIIVGKMSVSLIDLGSVNGTFKNGIQVQPNQLIILTKGIEVKFAEAPYICEIDSINIQKNEENDKEEQDEFQRNQRSRSRSAERKTQKSSNQDEKRKELWAKKDNIIKKENQIWNMGNLNEADKLKMMKLMGVKNPHTQIEADQTNTIQSIEKRNKELEKQFNSAISQKFKKGFGI